MGDGVLEGRQVLVESTNEEKKRYLEHDRKAVNNGAERPFFERIVLELTVCAALGHRPICMLQVLVKPLLC